VRELAFAKRLYKHFLGDQSALAQAPLGPSRRLATEEFFFVEKGISSALLKKEFLLLC